MIHVHELIGYLMIVWEPDDHEYAEKLFHEFSATPMWLMVSGLYEGAKVRLINSHFGHIKSKYYYDQLEEKQKRKREWEDNFAF